MATDGVATKRSSDVKLDEKEPKQKPPPPKTSGKEGLVDEVFANIKPKAKAKPKARQPTGSKQTDTSMDTAGVATKRPSDVKLDEKEAKHRPKSAGLTEAEYDKLFEEIMKNIEKGKSKKETKKEVKPEAKSAGLSEAEYNKLYEEIIKNIDKGVSKPKAKKTPEETPEPVLKPEKTTPKASPTVKPERPEGSATAKPPVKKTVLKEKTAPVTRDAPPTNSIPPSKIGIQKLRELLEDAKNKGKLNVSDTSRYMINYDDWKAAKGDKAKKEEKIKVLRETYKRLLYNQ
jgi:hypothetical protein